MRSAFIYNFLIEANIMAGIAILLMIPLRKIFRRQLGNSAICFGWLLVAIRLLCPLSLGNPLINDIRPAFLSDPMIRPIAGQIKVRVADAVESLSSLFWRADNRPAYELADRLHSDIENASVSIMLARIWLIGVLLVAGWFIFSNIRFRKQLRANRIEEISGGMKEMYLKMCRERKVRPVPVYFTDPVPGACLVGLFRPYIALPVITAPQDVINVLTHEICHLKNRDHIWNVLRMLCCAIHWFNPLVWLAASMSRTDCELRCDDRVTRVMDEQERKAYANVLVLAASRRSMPGIGVMATGMTMTGKRLKTRVTTVMQGWKPLRWLVVTFVILSSMCLIGAFATSETKEQLEISLGLGAEEHTLAEALSGGRRISDEQEAIACARELWEKYKGTDFEGTFAAWRNDDDSWYVSLSKREECACSVTFTRNGVAGDWGQDLFDYRWLTDGEYTESRELPEEELTEVREWALEQMEAINPGISSLIGEMEINYVREVDGAKYIYLHAYPKDSRYDYGVNVFIRLNADQSKILLECGMIGNG